MKAKQMGIPLEVIKSAYIIERTKQKQKQDYIGLNKWKVSILLKLRTLPLAIKYFKTVN